MDTVFFHFQRSETQMLKHNVTDILIKFSDQNLPETKSKLSDIVCAKNARYSVSRDDAYKSRNQTLCTSVIKISESTKTNCTLDITI